MARTKNKKVQQTFLLFIVTFLVSLVVITYFIKSFSPNVDVEIGGEAEYVEQTTSEDSDSDVKQAIDDRLKWIQLEDNMPTAEQDKKQKEEYNEETEEVKPSEKDTKKEKKNKKEELDAVELDTTVKPQKLQPPVPAQPPVATPPKMSKVYVGSYATIEQAIHAQNKLMNTSTSVSPFVKEVNGSYVLQAGSYANGNKAEEIAREINSLGFSARVVKE